MNLRDIEGDDVDCIHLALDRVQRWALVNTVMISGLHKKLELYCPALLPSEDELCSMELLTVT
jgi:hypothetical protein